MKSEFLILNDEMKQLVNDIVDDLENVSKYLDECEGMGDMIDKAKETLKKLDRVKWLVNYQNRLCKHLEK